MSASPAVQDLATEHFLSVVEPTVHEYLADLGSVRRAFLASIVLAHMAEHFYEARAHQCQGCSSGPAFLSKIADTDADFALLVDVTNASKHAVLTRPPRGRPMLLRKSTDVSAHEGYSSSSLSSSSSLPIDAVLVHITLPGGSYREIFPAIQGVNAMWRSLLGLPPKVLLVS